MTVNDFNGFEKKVSSFEELINLIGDLRIIYEARPKKAIVEIKRSDGCIFQVGIGYSSGICIQHIFGDEQPPYYLTDNGSIDHAEKVFYLGSSYTEVGSSSLVDFELAREHFKLFWLNEDIGFQEGWVEV